MVSLSNNPSFEKIYFPQKTDSPANWLSRLKSLSHKRYTLRRHRKWFLKQFERINVTNIVICQTEVFHFTIALALKFDAKVFQDDHGGLKWAFAENKIVSVVLQIFTWCFMIAIGREEDKIVD